MSDMTYEYKHNVVKPLGANQNTKLQGANQNTNLQGLDSPIHNDSSTTIIHTFLTPKVSRHYLHVLLSKLASFNAR